MSKNVVQYSLLISCPGDVQEEIRIIEEIVKNFNAQFSETLGISVIPRYWETDAYPQSGDKPQNLLNKQIVDNCDAVVAIFWTRFGTPTDKYQSGTEEEIARMMDSGKQVFMYFCDKQINPSDFNSEEYAKVNAFREKYKDQGIYWCYESNEKFKELFNAHLTKYFLSVQSISEVKAERHSKLKLVGIDEQDNLSDVAKIQQFSPKGEYSVEGHINKIKQLCNEIDNIDVHCSDNEYKRKICNNTLANSIDDGIGVSLMSGISSISVNINEHDQGIICNVASALKIKISNNFFDLGTLVQKRGYLGRCDTIGTNDEIKKLEKIQILIKICEFITKYCPIWTKFAEMKCLRLALQNCGTAIDKDIELKLTIPKSALITVKDFPQFDNEQMRYLLYDCEMDELFGIPEAVQYNDYYSSQEKPIGYVPPYIDPLTDKMSLICRQKIDYSEPFFNKLKDVFSYSVYETNENYILKLKFDYLKHNTTVAFPSVIFLKNDIDTLTYQITSQNNEDVINGEIKVVAE